jgi:hypothetical protein
VQLADEPELYASVIAALNANIQGGEFRPWQFHEPEHGMSISDWLVVRLRARHHATAAAFRLSAGSARWRWQVLCVRCGQSIRAAAVDFTT